MKNKLFLFMLLGLFLISFASAALTDGLVSYYKMDGNATDSTGLRNGIIPTGSGVTPSLGKIGQGMYFNGTSAIIVRGSASDFSDDFTFNLWAWTNGTDSGHFMSDWASNYLWYDVGNGKMRFFAKDCSDPGEATISVPEGVWNMITVKRDENANVSIYINGSIVWTAADYTGNGNPTAGLNLTIGMNGFVLGDAGSFGGIMDEFGMWNRSLSDAEILELYNSEDGLAYPFSEPEGQIYSQSEEDNSSATYPKFYDAVLHFAEWVTNATSLSSYIFSWNNSGSWENLSTTAFSGSNWSNVTKNITAVKNSNIGWYIWANDSEGKVNVTSIYQYLVRNSLPTSSNGMFNVSGVITNNPIVKVNVSIYDIDGLSDISMVIATIQKNNSIVGIGNTTALSYTSYASNPIFSDNTDYYLESSGIYENGVINLWVGRQVASTGVRYFVYMNSTNGTTFTSPINLTGFETPGQGYGLGYVSKVNSTYYMFVENFSKSESNTEVEVFNSTNGINWTKACANPITTGGYKKNPAFWYNQSDGVWHGLFEQGSGTFTVWYWNSTTLCTTWTKYSQQFGINAGNPDIKYDETNKSFIVYFGDLSSGSNTGQISVAAGTNLNSLSLLGKNVIVSSDQSWKGIMNTNPDVIIIGNNFSYKYLIYYTGNDTHLGFSYDSTNRTFEEAHFGTTSGYNQNITLSQVGSTSEWSGTFTNTSYIGLYNLTKIYVNDTDNGLNYSSYSTISFTTQEVELNDTSCDVYFNTTSPITYPDTFIVYTNCSSDYTLYRNGTSISNGTTIDGVGTYNISVVRTTQAGYSITYDEEEFTITQDTTSPCDIYFNTTSPITFPSQFLVWTNCSSAYTLYRNGSSITNNSAVISGADAYNISVVRTDQQNYSSIFNEEEFRVLTLDDGCAMFFNETTPLEYPGTFTVWTNCSTGTLRRNNTEILNNSEQSLTFGIYNFSFQRTDTQNYTTNYIDEYFTITDTIVPTTTIRLPTGTYYTNNITINFSVSDNNFANATYNINGTNMTTTSNETQTYITLKDGDYTFYVWAVDGGWATDYDTSSFRVQTVNVTLNSPPNATTNSLNKITFNCSAETSTGFLTNISLYTNHTGSWIANQTTQIVNSTHLVNGTTHTSVYEAAWDNPENAFDFDDATYAYILDDFNPPHTITNYIGKIFPEQNIDTIYTGIKTTVSNYYTGASYQIQSYNGTGWNDIAGATGSLANGVTLWANHSLNITTQGLRIKLTSATSASASKEFFVFKMEYTKRENSTTQNYTLLLNGPTSWGCRVCNVDECYFSSENRTISSNMYLHSINFTSQVYETEQTSYWINLSVNETSSLTNVTLYLNGTPYNTTNNGTIWNYTKYVLPSEVGNNSVIFGLNYSGTEYNTTAQYQNISPIALVVCGAGTNVLNATAGFTTIYQNYSFKDEGNSSVVPGTIPYAIWYYYLTNSTLNKTLTYTNVAVNSNYSLCFSPNTRNVSVDAYIQYAGNEYPQRIYDPALETYTNASTNQTLYLLTTDDGLYVTFQVVSAADQLLSGVEMNAYRTIGSVSTNVGTGTTGADGTITLWLNPDFLHTFTFEKEGYTTYSTSFTPTQSAYTITLGGGSSGGTAADDYTKGVKRYIYPTTKELTNDTTYNFIFNVTSSYWDLDSFGFNLRLTNDTIISGDTSTISGSGASLEYDVTNQSKIYMDYYWVIEGNYTNGTTSWVVSNSLNTDYSIKTFFTDADAYMDSGLFGIDNFGRYLIAFLILFLVVGVLGYKYGMTNPIFISALTFGVVFFLDVITGIIPQIGKVPHVITYVAGLIMALVIIGEATR